MDKVTILYKSGHKVHFEAHDFTVWYAEDGNPRVTKAEWRDAKPKPLFLNVGAIEAVWMGHV